MHHKPLRRENFRDTITKKIVREHPKPPKERLKEIINRVRELDEQIRTR